MSANTSAPGLPKGMLTASYKDRTELNRAFMPFLKQTGLFVPTNRIYQMGEEVFLMVKLPESDHRHATAGKVSWINPKEGGRPQGVGVSFVDGEAANFLRSEIEKLLLGIPHSVRLSYTF